MAFKKKSKSLLRLWFIAFYSFENRPWGSKSSANGGQNRVHQGTKLSASTQTLTLCGCTQFWPQAALYFDPRQHSILTPRAYFQNWKKSINHIFKRNLDFLKKAIHLIIFLRFYDKKLFFNLGIPLMSISQDRKVNNYGKPFVK